MSDTKKPAKSGPAFDGFTEDERAAMKDHAQELKRAARRGSKPGKEDEENAVLAKIAELADPDRAMAERIHAIVKAVAPDLTARTYYGMPAYAKDGKIICWYQPAQKFKSRYGMLGFSDNANLDDGNSWPVAYALAKLTAADEERIGALIRQAAS